MPGPIPLPDRFEDGDLLVRRWTVDDAPALHEAVAANVDHLRPWMPWIALEPQSVEQRRALIEGWERDWRAGGDVVLGVLLDGVVAGGAGLHKRLGPDGLEIGYWIDRAHVRQGLATRVSSVLTSAAFTVPEIARVQISCDDANIASARVPEKLGFTRLADYDRPILAPAETGLHRVYRVTRADWTERTR